jgi:hypothetical protein
MLGGNHMEIDPFQEGQPMISNYKLLTSGIPRPISLLSALSKDSVWPASLRRT